MTDAKFTVQQLMKYKDELWDNVNNRCIALNNDRSHNAIAMSVIFSTSKKVRMFCGNFSLFRNQFAKKAVECISDFDKSDPIDSFPINVLHNSFESFFEKEGTSMEVIILKYTEKFDNNERFYTKIKEKVDNEKLIFFRLKEDYYDLFIKKEHFAFGEKIYRQETNMEKHEALCGFNYGFVIDLLSERFEKMKEFSEKFDYVK